MKSIKRRKKLIEIGLAAAFVAGPGLIHAELTGKKPNVILILADDLGHECLSCYGSASYKTPVLDRLAATGVRFTTCHSQPICTPSRVKIMTGKYNFRNYTSFSELAAGQVTFANVLKNAGYATCIAGKWQLGGQEKTINEFGFDEYCLWQLFSWPVEKRGNRYADPTICRNGKMELKEGMYGPDLFCDFVNDFIERKKSGPFFVYYPMVLVHDPFMPTPDSRGWQNNRNKEDKNNFKDMVEYADKIVGRIVKKLDELHLRENTLIIFTGDNGTSRVITTVMKDGRIIKGGKGRTTDFGTHVPLITNWKGTSSAGKVCEDLIGFEDFLPTLVDISGGEMPSDVDGISFLPQIMGYKGNPKPFLFTYINSKHPDAKCWEDEPGTIEPEGKAKGPLFYTKRFVRDHRWKLYSTGYLYDIHDDILEQKPILPEKDNEESAIARERLRKNLDSIMSGSIVR